MLMQLDIELIPVELRELDQWVVWQNRDGRKVPINARTQQPAKSNDHATWCDFQTACDALALNSNLSGLGFVFAEGDGLVGIDLDECIDNRGKIAEWALSWLCSFDSYAEISPSGRGLKLWCYGEIERGRKAIIEEREGKSPGVEVYSSGRYFTITGQRWEGLTESAIRPCQPQLDRLHKKYFSEPEPPKPQPNTGTSPAPSSGQLSVQERAARYLAKMPPAVSGQHGHDRIYHAACVLILGFAMSVDDAWPVMREWNLTNEPPFSEEHARRKLDEANKLGGERGYFLTGRKYQGSNVELQELFEKLQRGDIPAASIAPNPSNFPEIALNPPGFLGEVIDYNLRSAIYPYPHLALAGHLALLATLTGHKITDALWGTRTNAYFCGLGPSRGGKDWARRINQRILHFAGLENLEGEENFASSAAIYSALGDNPVSLYQIDEIANLLATTQDAKRSPHLFKIADVFLRLWSSSAGTLKADAYADRKKNKVLKHPHCVVYGTAVPHSFWQTITQENVTGGLLGRFLVFEVPDVDNGYVDMQKPEQFPDGPPTSILNAAQAWSDLKPHNGNLASLDGSSPQVIAHTPDAENRYWQHANETNERSKTEAPGTAAVWRGTPEKTSKLALLFAASRATTSQIEDGHLDKTLKIELQDVERAVAVSNWCTRRMMHQVDLHVADSEWEKILMRALHRLKPGEEVTRSEFNRMVKRKRRELDEIIDTLVEIGFVDIRYDTVESGNSVCFIRRRI